MRSTYQPDSWHIVVITSEDNGAVYKVLAGWSGGYTTGSSWKLSSGIEGVTRGDDGIYTLPQSSGSTYYLHENAERMSGIMLGTFSNFAAQAEETGDFTIKVIEMTEFLELLKADPKLLEH